MNYLAIIIHTALWPAAGVHAADTADPVCHSWTVCISTALWLTAGFHVTNTADHVSDISTIIISAALRVHTCMVHTVTAAAAWSLVSWCVAHMGQSHLG